jgi:hypothetical protein
MREALRSRITALERQGKVKARGMGMLAMYEHFYALGLGDVIPEDNPEGMIDWERGIAYQYRRILDEMDASAAVPDDVIDQRALVRYREKLAADTLLPFDFPDEEFTW